jgi:hypothetical protein
MSITLTRFTLAIFCTLACGSSALAQYGVSNVRDGNGNLVRDNGSTAGRVVNQGPINNGPISSAPTQPTTANTRMNKGTAK